MYEAAKRIGILMTLLLVAACGLFGPSESHEDGEEEEASARSFETWSAHAEVG